MSEIAEFIATNAGQALIAEAVSGAARPLVSGVRRALARRGYAKTEIYEAISALEEQGHLQPSTIGILNKLPRGLTDREVRDLLTSPEFAQLSRTIIAANLVSDMPTISTCAEELKRMFRARFHNLNANEVEAYCETLALATTSTCRAAANKLETTVGGSPEDLRWSYMQLSNNYLRGIADSSQTLSEFDISQTLKDLPEWRTRYAASFRLHHSEIEVPDLMRRHRVHYGELYVDCSIAPHNKSASNLQVSTGRRLNVHTMLELVDRTVVLGDPGAGKSTTSSLIAINSVDTGDLIPFIVVMKDVAFEAGGFSLLDHLDQTLRSKYQCPATKRLIDQLLRDGRAFLVFDGLDELLDGHDRKGAVAVIEKIATLYPFAKILVTSRRIGYSIATLNQRIFDEYLIEGFESEQVKEYATKWFQLQERVEQDDVADLVDDLMESSESIPDLRSNPLLLAFICILYSGHRHIPRRRPQLYRKCIELVLSEWDKARGITEQVPELDLYELVLTRIAHLSLIDSRFTRGFTEDAVYEAAVPALLEEQVPDERSARRIIAELLAVCRGRGWLFTDVGLDEDGHDLFAFTHLSFREYFAARHISRSSSSPEDMADTLLPQLAAGRWGVLAQICLSLGAANTVAGGSRAVIRMLDFVDERVQLRTAARRSAARNISGVDISKLQTEKSHDEDVAIIEFILRSSDILSLSSDVLSRMIDLSFNQLVNGGSIALKALLENRHRYNREARERIAHLLSESLLKAVTTPTDSLSEDILLRAWIAAHFRYIGTIPGSGRVSPRQVSAVCGSANVPNGNWLDLARVSPTWWTVALHLGRSEVLQVRTGSNVPATGDQIYLKLFTQIPRPASHFGPSSTVSWIIDCLSNADVSAIDQRRAIAVLRQLGRIDLQSVFEIGAPPTFDVVELGTSSLEQITRRLIGYGPEVLRGWILLVAGYLELYGRATQRSVQVSIDRAGVFGLFNSPDITRRLGLDVSGWLMGDVGIWEWNDFAVS